MNGFVLKTKSSRSNYKTFPPHKHSSTGFEPKLISFFNFIDVQYIFRAIKKFFIEGVCKAYIVSMHVYNIQGSLSSSSS